MAPLVEHTIREDGVHEFILLSNQRQAVDVFYRMIGEVFDDAPTDQTIRYLLDWSQSGAPSLQYMFHAAQEWGRRHPNVAPGRGVILFSQRGVLPLANMLIRVVMQLWGEQITLRLGTQAQRDEMIKWLTATQK